MSRAVTPGELDWIVASSETHREYPSLAAQVHKQIGARESCGALDVGGACLGLLNAFASAQALLQSGPARTIAIVTADVHSRSLSPRRVAGEFGGLFGDGASAFVLRCATGDRVAGQYVLGNFVFGCASQYSEAICVADAKDGGLAVQFDGEALSRAAITRMERVIGAIEQQSGIARAEAGAFATHQPNPRLVTLLAKQCGVAAELFPSGGSNLRKPGFVNMWRGPKYRDGSGLEDRGGSTQTDLPGVVGTRIAFWKRMAEAT